MNSLRKVFASLAVTEQDRAYFTALAGWGYGLSEVEAFTDIHRRWQRLGYPFDSLTPSYATAIGSSVSGRTRPTSSTARSTRWIYFAIQ